MFIKVLLLSSVLLGIALIGLGIQTFFSSKKAFPETRVGHNKELRKRKIYCSKTQQKIIDKGITGDHKGLDMGCACSS